MSSSLRATELRFTVADWGSGISAHCTAGPIFFAGAGNGWPHNAPQYQSLAHTNQLPLPRL